MHREHQGRRKTREDQISPLVIAPVPIGTGPAERKQTVSEFAYFGPGPVAHDGEVGNQPHIPEEHRHREIGRDGEHVPHERRAELRPDAVRVWNRKQPPTQPDAPDVNQRENAGAHDGEDCHCLGRAVDGRAPALAQQKENRRNQCSGVADADPPDEVDDGPSPHDRLSQAPDAHARGHEVENHAQEHQQQGCAGDERAPPPCRRLALGDARDGVGYPADRALVRDQWLALQFRRRRLKLHRRRNDSLSHYRAPFPVVFPDARGSPSPAP